MTRFARRPVLMEQLGALPSWKSLIEQMKKKKRASSAVSATSAAQARFHVTLAVISVMTGGFAFIGALVLRDFLKQNMDRLMSDLKRPWVKSLLYMFVGITIAVLGTLAFSIIQYRTQEDQEKQRAKDVRYAEHRELCNSIYLALLREKNVDAMENYLGEASACPNFEKIRARVAKAKAKRSECDGVLHGVKSSPSLERMAELIEAHADCYNTDAMQVHLKMQQEKQRACDEALRDMKAAAATTDPETIRSTMYLGKETCYNRADMRLFLEGLDGQINDM